MLVGAYPFLKRSVADRHAFLRDDAGQSHGHGWVHAVCLFDLSRTTSVFDSA